VVFAYPLLLRRLGMLMFTVVPFASDGSSTLLAVFLGVVAVEYPEDLPPPNLLASLVVAKPISITADNARMAGFNFMSFPSGGYYLFLLPRDPHWTYGSRIGAAAIDDRNLVSQEHRKSRREVSSILDCGNPESLAVAAQPQSREFGFARMITATRMIQFATFNFFRALRCTR
jgi:hypothetical protein